MDNRQIISKIRSIVSNQELMVSAFCVRVRDTRCSMGRGVRREENNRQEEPEPCIKDPMLLVVSPHYLPSFIHLNLLKCSFPSNITTAKRKSCDDSG